MECAHVPVVQAMEKGRSLQKPLHRRVGISGRTHVRSVQRQNVENFRHGDDIACQYTNIHHAIPLTMAELDASGTLEVRERLPIRKYREVKTLI